MVDRGAARKANDEHHSGNYSHGRRLFQMCMTGVPRLLRVQIKGVGSVLLGACTLMIVARKSSDRTSRTEQLWVGAVVLTTHLGLVFLAWWHSNRAAVRHADLPDAWLTWLEATPTPEAESLPQANDSREAPVLRSVQRSSAPRSIAPLPETREVPTAAIDWRAAAGEAAARVLEAEGEARKLARAFEPKRTPGLAEQPIAPRPPPHFRWSEAHTERLRRDENGNTILRINERCVIVNFLLPACAIGEIPTYDDLFKDMNRSAEFGDWNDDSATRRDNMPP
jgi:hypothetical protein